MTAMLLYRTLNIRIRPEVMDKLADIQKALGGVAMVQAVESSILAYDIGVTLDGTKKAYGKTAFRAPTLAEVKEHCGENGYKFDPEAFWSFYESKGWKVGNQPMKSWKAACVTWQGRETANGHPPVAKPEASLPDSRHAEIDAEIAAMEKARRERPPIR